MAESIDPFEARQQVLEPLLAARKLLSVLEGAEAAGVIGLLVEGPATVAEIGERSGLDDVVAEAVVAVLAASEVVVVRNGRVELSEPWFALCRPGGFTPFASLVRGDRVAAEHLRGLGGGDYWSLPSADRIAMAASVSPDPIEGGFAEILKTWVANGHPFAIATSQATRMLELGCGLAGAALSGLVAFPGIRETVGVELSADLATEAERRAEVLGVADRFRVVCGDATDFEDPEPFDAAFWSQFFFAEGSRAGAVAVLLRSIRSGGTVGAPVRWYDAATGNPTSLPAQQYAQFRLTAQASGVPERSPAQVAEELASAGFTDPRIIASGPTQAMVVVTRP